MLLPTGWVMGGVCEGGLIGDGRYPAHTRALVVKATEDDELFRSRIAVIDQELKELDR